MVRFQSGTAHGDQDIVNLTMELAVVLISSKDGGGSMFTVDALLCEQCACWQDALLGDGDTFDLVFADGSQDFLGAHRLTDRDAFGQRATQGLVVIKCAVTPALQGWGYKARPPNLRK